MNLGLARTYFRQLRPFDALRYLGLKALQRALDRWAMTSYAQTGEDRIVASLLGPGPGFYVDVGCNHPVRQSNTFELYKRGWRGINVDANEELIALCRRTRPRDVSVCAVISDSQREVVFTEFDDANVSSLSAEHVARWQSQRQIVRRRKAVAQTLDDVLAAANAPHRFELLSVDVEGHDFEVLSSLSLDVYRPKLIVVEMHDFTLAEPARSKAWSHLVANGYELVGYAVMNGYFRDSRP
jgi:FkbM family methyltransferase